MAIRNMFILLVRRSTLDVRMCRVQTSDPSAVSFKDFTSQNTIHFECWAAGTLFQSVLLLFVYFADNQTALGVLSS